MASIWNPHATKAIYIILATLSKPISGASANYAQRITARGTPGSTVTPDSDNDFDRLLSPISGAVLDLAAFSVQPTLAGPDYFRFMQSQNNPGPTQELYFGEDGLRIPAGTGLGIFQSVGVTNTVDLSIVWDE